MIDFQIDSPYKDILFWFRLYKKASNQTFDRWDKQASVKKMVLENVPKIHARISRVFKGAPNADFLPSYEYFRIRQGSKWPPKKFESDDVIMGSTGVK